MAGKDTNSSADVWIAQDGWVEAMARHCHATE